MVPCGPEQGAPWSFEKLLSFVLSSLQVEARRTASPHLVRIQYYCGSNGAAANKECTWERLALVQVGDETPAVGGLALLPGVGADFQDEGVGGTTALMSTRSEMVKG